MYQTPYWFYLPLFPRLYTPTVFRKHFKGILHIFFDSELSFCITRTFGTKYKVRSCWWVWVVFFYVRLSDTRYAGQWIYKGTSAFKNIRKETFPTQTDQWKWKVSDAQTVLQAAPLLSRGGRWLICCFMLSLWFFSLENSFNFRPRRVASPPQLVTLRDVIAGAVETAKSEVSTGE